jgi:hypothetical protein
MSCDIQNQSILSCDDLSLVAGVALINRVLRMQKKSSRNETFREILIKRKSALRIGGLASTEMAGTGNGVKIISTEGSALE